MKKRNLGEGVFQICNGLVLLIVSLVTLYPFLYVIFASFSDPLKLMGNSSLLLKPLGFSLGAYKKVFLNPSMYFSGGLIPGYLLIKDLGMINSRLSLILPGAVSTFNLMIMITGFEGIPESLEESARIDGAGDWTILFRIIMPLAKPTIMVILLYYAVGHWNAWFHAMIYLRDADKMPLQIFLRDILTRSQLGAMTGQTDVEDVGQTIKYATIIVSTVPILCVYPFIQKHFVKGVMIGAVKE